ncbi:hypothetical protein MWU50_05495 [Flavobacteriaceae bacterium S0862]|nr:hypothetical protein [Flavobacteriaceae bacterium S0862]
MKEKAINFVDYLGQPIEELLKEKNLEIVKNGLSALEGYTSSVFEFAKNTEYLGTQINSLSVTLDEKKLIQLITVTSISIIDKCCLDAFINKYNNPTHISKIDKLIYESKSTNKDGFHQQLRKRKYSTKEVSLNETPNLILWKKQDYKIEIKFHYKHNATQIRFYKTN